MGAGPIVVTKSCEDCAEGAVKLLTLTGMLLLVAARLVRKHKNV